MSAAVNTWPATKGVRLSGPRRAADFRVNTSMAKSAPQFCFCSSGAKKREPIVTFKGALSDASPKWRKDT